MVNKPRMFSIKLSNSANMVSPHVKKYNTDTSAYAYLMFSFVILTVDEQSFILLIDSYFDVSVCTIVHKEHGSCAFQHIAALNT